MVSKLKRQLIIIVLTFLGLNGISQTSNQVEIYVAPTLSYRRLDDGNFGINHTAGVRFDIGLIYMKQIKQKIRIGAGIGYSKMGYNLTGIYPDYQGNPVEIEKKFYRNFIELPVKISMKVNNESKNSFFVDLGLVNQLLVSMRSDSPDDDFDETLSYKDLKDRYMKTYNIAFLIGATYQKSFDNNLSLRLAPFFKYGILSLDNIHDWNAGLKIGIGYNF